MEKTITLAVVFHNERKQIRNLLNSIDEALANSKAQWKFLFIDNKSKDISSVIIKDWSQSHPHVELDLIYRQENNMGAARQQALELASTKWLGFVDADCILSADWLAAAEKIVQEVSSDKLVVGGQSNYVGNEKWHAYAIWLNDQFPLGKNPSKPTVVDHVPTNNILIKRQEALEAGGFDPFFHRVGEDLDFSVRMRKQGKIVFNPELRLSHQLPADQTTWDKKMKLYGQAQMQVFLKNRGGVTWTKFLPLFVETFFWFLFIWIVANQDRPIYVDAIALCFLVVFFVPASGFFISTISKYGTGEFIGFFKYFFPKKKRSSSLPVIGTER